MDDKFHCVKEIKLVFRAVMKDRMAKKDERAALRYLTESGIMPLIFDDEDFDVCLPKSSKCARCDFAHNLKTIDDHRACIVPEDGPSDLPLFGGVKEPMLLAEERFQIDPLSLNRKLF